MWKILTSVRLRSLLQFRLRTLLAVVTIVAVCLGWYMEGVRKQQRAVALVRQLGASVEYSYLPPAPPPPLPMPLPGEFTADLDLPFEQNRFPDPNLFCRHFPAIARWICAQCGEDYVLTIRAAQIDRRLSADDPLDHSAAEQELARLCHAHGWHVWGNGK